MTISRPILIALKRGLDLYRRIAPSPRGQLRARLWVGMRMRALAGLRAERMAVGSDGRQLMFWLSPSSTLGACAWAFGSFDAAGVGACAATLRAAAVGVMLDIGANVGIFSLFSATSGPRLRVVAVEAHPDALELLRQNLAEHALAIAATGSGVEVVPVALGAKDGMVDFFASDDDSASSLNRMPHLRGRLVRVPMERGDTLVARLGLQEIALCKLDVEGGELQVLQGLSETLRQQRIRCLRMEINLLCCAEAGHAPADLLALLASHGYRMVAESQARFAQPGWNCEDFVFEPGAARTKTEA